MRRLKPLNATEGQLGTWFGAGLAVISICLITVVAEQRERINTLNYRIEMLTIRIDKMQKP